MKVLVTGGAGYIGSHTVVELIKAGHQAVILDNLSNSEAFIIDRINELTGRSTPFYQKDFANKAKISQLLKKEQIEGIIHFAAFKQVGESVTKPLKYYRNNVGGLISLLEAISDSNIKYFVFSSSCTVYGEPDSLPVTEDSPVKPATSPYGASKQMDEVILKDFSAASSKLSALALRYFNPIGAHPSARIGELPIGTPANLVPFITQTAAGIREKLIVYGNDYPTEDGTCIRDYIHVVDLARAHVKAIDFLSGRQAGQFDFFNIGTGKGSSVVEVINTFEQVTGVKLNYVFGPRREGDIISTYAAVDKANKMLNWKADKSLEEALLDAWNWQQTLAKK